MYNSKSAGKQTYFSNALQVSTLQHGFLFHGRNTDGIILIYWRNKGLLISKICESIIVNVAKSINLL